MRRTGRQSLPPARPGGRQPKRAAARKALARSRWSLKFAQDSKIFTVCTGEVSHGRDGWQHKTVERRASQDNTGGRWIRRVAGGLAALLIFGGWMSFCCYAQSSDAIAAVEQIWNILPEETVVAVRVPAGQVLAETLVEETMLGAVMWSEARQQAIAQLLASDTLTDWSQLQTQLAAYGLEARELLGLLAGESGYAMMMSAPPETEPAFTGLAWMEPGAQLGRRLLEAITQAIEEQDAEHPITQIDLMLADMPVQQFQIPVIGVEHTAKFDLDEQYNDLSAEQRQAAWEQAYREWQASAVKTTRYHIVLLSLVGERLLVVHSLAAVGEEAVDAVAEQLADTLGQLLARRSAGDAAGFIGQVAADPAVARVLDLDGMPAWEIFGDVAPVLALLRARASDEEQGAQMDALLGLDGVGPFASRSVLRDAIWQTQLAIALPAPRRGLMRLIDQEPLPSDPPAWVPAGVLSYSQWSFDAGQAYELLQEQLVQAFPERMAGTIAVLEAQAQAFAGASLGEVLSSLGNRHLLLHFGSDAEDPTGGQQRLALVWRVRDQQLWSRIFKALTPWAKMAPGLEFAEEQGFSGWRLQRDGVAGGLFLGNGSLVLAWGSHVLEEVLSSLNNPPVGKAALRGSSLWDQAAALLPLEPGVVGTVSDGKRSLQQLRVRLEKHLEQWTESVQELAGDEADKASHLAWLALAAELLPSRREASTMLGVMVSRWEVDEHGLFGSSASALPGP